MRVFRWVLVSLVLLALLLVVTDRVAVRVAQDAVADQVAMELANRGVESQPPEVSFDRVPFLTQVVAGRYETLTVRLRDVGNERMRVPLVELTVSGVTASMGTLASGEGPITAERVDGTVTVGYATVAEQLGVAGLELAPDPSGRVAVRMPAVVAGLNLNLTGLATVTPVRGGMILLRVDSLNVTGDVTLPPAAQPLLDQVSQRLSVPVPLPQLPYGLQLESVRAGQDGLLVTVSAVNVPIAG